MGVTTRVGLSAISFLLLMAKKDAAAIPNASQLTVAVGSWQLAVKKSQEKHLCIRGK